MRYNTMMNMYNISNDKDSSIEIEPKIIMEMALAK